MRGLVKINVRKGNEGGGKEKKKKKRGGRREGKEKGNISLKQRLGLQVRGAAPSF